MRHPLLALADVHRATSLVEGRPVELFIFDHHRTAFTIWCHEATRLGGPLALFTLDRHMDLGTPALPPPAADAPLEALDAYARHRLAPSNDDHIVAALEAGAIADAVVVARSHAPPSLDAFRPYRDARGGLHRFAFAKSPAFLVAAPNPLPPGDGPLVLDVDLDCFTTMSDGDPDDVLIWDEEQMLRWLQPPGADDLWAQLRARVSVVTLAREPFHCGGFDRGAELWRRFSRVFFRDLLQTDAP
jgi:hypothetical protein